MLVPPINLHAWVEQHRHLLKPPVGNKCIQQDGFIIMIVGGPNARTDYHYDEGPEWFFQLEGEMVLKVQDDGTARDIPIRAGEIFLLPPKVPHSPQRAAGSIGLVIERERLPHEQDGLQWYCRSATTNCMKRCSRWKISKPTSRRCSIISIARSRCAPARSAGMCTLRRNAMPPSRPEPRAVGCTRICQPPCFC